MVIVLVLSFVGVYGFVKEGQGKISQGREAVSYPGTVLLKKTVKIL